MNEKGPETAYDWQADRDRLVDAILPHVPFDGWSDAAFKARTDAGRLKNTTITKSHFDTLDVAANSVDRVLWILGPHELYYKPPNSNGLGADDKAYAEIKRVLKPGGLFIVMDHAADKGSPVPIWRRTTAPTSSLGSAVPRSR